MNNVQSMITIGAITIFSLISIRFNATVLETTNVEVENKIYLTAFSLADDLIEEIKQKAFDEETVVFRSINPEELTPSNDFAPDFLDPGETSDPLTFDDIDDYNGFSKSINLPQTSDPLTFDDIDDYNGFSKSVNLPHAEGFVVTSQVEYVQSNNQNMPSSTQTFFKRVTVWVSNDYLSHPVKLSFIFTLHSK